MGPGHLPPEEVTPPRCKLFNGARHDRVGATAGRPGTCFEIRHALTPALSREWKKGHGGLLGEPFLGVQNALSGSNAGR